MNKVNLAVALLALLLMTACKKNGNTKAENYQINPASVATWKGFLRTGYFNEGTIGVESENLKVENGKVKSGTFRMPLSTLANLNLPPDLKPELIHHLQSSDFFHMALHPEIRFEITKAEPYGGDGVDAVEGANFKISGMLSILGKPLPISFPAKITLGGGKIAVLAKLKVDRTKWGMTYSADPELPDEAYILPEIDIFLDLKGSRS